MPNVNSVTSYTTNLKVELEDGYTIKSEALVSISTLDDGINPTDVDESVELINAAVTYTDSGKELSKDDKEDFDEFGYLDYIDMELSSFFFTGDRFTSMSNQESITLVQKGPYLVQKEKGE